MRDNKKPLFYFFQTELTNCFIIQSVRLICLLCNLLDPDAKTQITLSELAHAQSSPKSFFSVPGHLQCFILAGRGYCKTPEAQEVHFKAFQWACETRVSLEFF